ncbi:hypothetical protein FACS1894109_21570 [Spirochaetia bacterium]|nr:hypothetical protein FACS1894109_21570 [Spirochaetia bacterium]
MEKKECVFGVAENAVDVDSMWNCITSSLTQQPVEIETVRLDGNNGVWFLASFRLNEILIDNAVHNQPTNIHQQRRISKTEFKTIFPYYFQWKSGTCPRNVIRDMPDKNTSYIFAIIEYFLKKYGNY